MKECLFALALLAASLSLSGCGKSCKDYCGQCGASEKATQECHRACDACGDEGDALAGCIDDNVSNYCAAGTALTILSECAPESAAYSTCLAQKGLDTLFE